MNLIRQHEKRLNLLFTLAPSLIHAHTHTHTQVDMKVSQYARYIFEPVDTNWSVVHEDGDMKVQLTNLDPLLHVFSIPSLSSATYFPLPSFSLFPSPCPPPPFLFLLLPSSLSFYPPPFLFRSSKLLSLFPTLFSSPLPIH